MSDSYDKIFYDTFYSKHCEKGDEELRSIVLLNAKKIMAFPTNASPSMLAEATKLNAESKACNDILAERKQRKDEVDAALDEWKSGADFRLQMAILNLPTATSPIGQLIAAILEEEKLTAEELSGWCDELAVIEYDQLKTILDNLVTEQILKVDDGRYECINVCTPTLYPENPVESAMKKLYSLSAGDTRKYSDIEVLRAKVILTIIDLEDRPLSKKEVYELLDSYSFLVKMGEAAQEDLEMSEYDVNGIVSKLVRDDILSTIMLAGESMYYFKQLGKLLKKIEGVDELLKIAFPEEENATDVRKDHKEVARMILAVLLEMDSEMSMSEIMECSPELSQYSNQRVMAIARKLSDAGVLKRTEVDRKSVYAINKEKL